MLSLLEANFRDWERLFFIPDLIAAMLRYAIFNCFSQYFGIFNTSGYSMLSRIRDSMDNNRAERALRRIALGRKNYYGTFAEWSGQFAAICLSVL